MLIVFGLGNNQSKYLSTKHNAGRIVLEHVAENLRLKFHQKSHYYEAKIEIQDETVWLLYSTGFMNTSGEALYQFLQFYKLKFSDKDKLLVIQDDSDQFEGWQKLAVGGGSAGHHGINSIYRHLPGLAINPEQVWRLKVGIRPPQNKERSETFVLSQISQAEKSYYNFLGDTVTQLLPEMVQNNLSKAQGTLNTILTEKV